MCTLPLCDAFATRTAAILVTGRTFSRCADAGSIQSTVGRKGEGHKEFRCTCGPYPCSETGLLIDSVQAVEVRVCSVGIADRVESSIRRAGHAHDGQILAQRRPNERGHAGPQIQRCQLSVSWVESVGYGVRPTTKNGIRGQVSLRKDNFPGGFGAGDRVCCQQFDIIWAAAGTPFTVFSIRAEILGSGRSGASGLGIGFNVTAWLQSALLPDRSR